MNLGAQSLLRTHQSRTFVNKNCKNVNNELAADKATCRYWMSVANAYKNVSRDLSYAQAVKANIPGTQVECKKGLKPDLSGKLRTESTKHSYPL